MTSPKDKNHVRKTRAGRRIREGRGTRSGGGTRTGKRKRASRVIYCRDALPWLATRKGTLDAIVTSLPEMEEMGLSATDYLSFFRKTARLCLEAVHDTGYCIFLQTDRKYKGWMDKSYYVSDEAQQIGMRLLWHKIALRVGVGKASLFRPGYSHMLCYSKKGKVGGVVADVVEQGERMYPNAFGVEAVGLVVDYLKKQGIRHVVDPFVGSGTVVAVANHRGMDTTGLDIDPLQCKKARNRRVIDDPLEGT